MLLLFRRTTACLLLFSVIALSVNFINIYIQTVQTYDAIFISVSPWILHGTLH